MYLQRGGPVLIVCVLLDGDESRQQLFVLVSQDEVVEGQKSHGNHLNHELENIAASINDHTIQLVRFYCNCYIKAITHLQL